MTTIWTAACPRPTVLSARGLVRPLPTPSTLTLADLEYGRVRPGGAGMQAEQHVFAKFSAIQINAQVKGSGTRVPMGPHPWRPPE